MKATFHYGPLDGQTTPRDDWDSFGPPFLMVQVLPPGTIEAVIRCDPNQPLDSPDDGVFYQLDHVDAQIAHYRYVGHPGIRNADR